MMIRFALAALALTLSTGVDAAPKRKVVPPPAPVALPDIVRVALTTEMGTITIDLDHKHAPISTANFVRYVDQKRLDGIAFYRVMRLPYGEQPNGLIQGGPRGDPKRVLPPIAHEPTSVTGLKHLKGAISMARLAPGTANADFSILISDIPGLDADANPNDPAGYAVFGYVVEGMDVVRKIYDQPLDPVKGEGFMKGQYLAKELKIVTARRVKIVAPVPVTPTAPSPMISATQGR